MTREAQLQIKKGSRCIEQDGSKPSSNHSPIDKNLNSYSHTKLPSKELKKPVKDQKFLF
jgi:hypothetical protein